jgi:atypical dual specificity phosphatase
MVYAEDVPALFSHGIRAILSLTGWSPLTDLPAGMSHLHLPIPDFTAPDEETIDRAVSFIRENVVEDLPVLVHCAAGLGRTGTVLACYLVSTGIEPGEAIARVREARPGSVETSAQELCVHEYAARRR